MGSEMCIRDRSGIITDERYNIRSLIPGVDTMPTPVPLSILSRRDQRIRLIIVLLLALGMGIAARAIRPHLSGPVHYEALVSLVVLSAACLVLVLGLRRISYWRAALVFIIEMTALWACFVIGWIIIERQLVEDLFAVIGLF